MKPRKQVKLDGNGLNMAISSVILPEKDMRWLGFTDHSGKNWYRCSTVGADITLNITIPKDGSRLKIEVLDENFGQHYDYQDILKRHPTLPNALSVKKLVEDSLESLTEAGVLTGYKRGIYI